MTPIYRVHRVIRVIFNDTMCVNCLGWKNVRSTDSCRYTINIMYIVHLHINFRFQLKLHYLYYNKHKSQNQKYKLKLYRELKYIKSMIVIAF